VGYTFEIGWSQEGQVCEIYAHTAVVVKIRVFWSVKPIDR